MADIGKPSVALFVNRRLISAASLQVVITDQIHVALLNLLLRYRSNAQRGEDCDREPGFPEVMHERAHIQTPSTVIS